MFTEMEFKIFKQLSEHEDLRIIFVVTFSSEKTDYALWTIEDFEGGFRIKNVKAYLKQLL